MPPAGGDKRGRKKEPKKKNAPGPKPPKASTDREAEDSKDEDEHPFALGAMLLCEWGLEKSRRLCQIIERAQDSEDASLYNYYVHFLDYNRRMDEWVTPNRILALPSEAARLAKDHARGHHGKEDTEADEDKGSRRKKRRNGEEEEEEEDKPMGHTVVADMEHDEHEGIDEASLKEHEEVTKVKNVRTIELGRHVMECWYFSPFPKEYYPNGFVDRLYFCEFSLRYFAHKSELARYQARGVDRHPPGNEIYRKDGLSMFEVDGAENKEYCESLCYMAKLFLDHKTLYYEVDPFLFYVMCEYDERGFHPTGYFSKEKYSDVGYNLACILTFPCYQRKGYGRFLIAFSYELSKKESKVGSPEKPLSDLGAIGYRSYWAAEVLMVLKKHKGPSISIMEISKITSILSDDIINALQYLGILKCLYNSYALCVPPAVLDDLIKRHPIKEPRVDPEKLHWAPLVGQFTGKDKWSIKAKRPGEQVD